MRRREQRRAYVRVHTFFLLLINRSTYTTMAGVNVGKTPKHPWTRPERGREGTRDVKKTEKCFVWRAGLERRGTKREPV